MIPRFATGADAPLIEAICSHPEVRRWTAQDGSPPFDVVPWLQPVNMVVLVEGGCFLSNWLGDVTFGVHTNILPEARGRQALESGRMALALGFLRSNAETFVTMVPENNRGAKWFTNQMGFRPTFRQAGRWRSGATLWDVSHYRLDIDDWILQGHLTPIGEAFHGELESLGLHSGHGRDAVHDAYVGALCGMVNAGKAWKGVRIYNRWARTAGYAPLTIEGNDPLVINAYDFRVKVTGSGMQIEEREYA